MPVRGFEGRSRSPPFKSRTPPRPVFRSSFVPGGAMGKSGSLVAPTAVAVAEDHGSDHWTPPSYWATDGVGKDKDARDYVRRLMRSKAEAEAQVVLLQSQLDDLRAVVEDGSFPAKRSDAHSQHIVDLAKAKCEALEDELASVRLEAHNTAAPLKFELETMRAALAIERRRNAALTASATSLEGRVEQAHKDELSVVRAINAVTSHARALLFSFQAQLGDTPDQAGLKPPFPHDSVDAALRLLRNIIDAYAQATDAAIITAVSSASTRRTQEALSALLLSPPATVAMGDVAPPEDTRKLQAAESELRRTHRQLLDVEASNVELRAQLQAALARPAEDTAAAELRAARAGATDARAEAQYLASVNEELRDKLASATAKLRKSKSSVAELMRRMTHECRAREVAVAKVVTTQADIDRVTASNKRLRVLLRGARQSKGDADAMQGMAEELERWQHALQACHKDLQASKAAEAKGRAELKAALHVAESTQKQLEQADAKAAALAKRVSEFITSPVVHTYHTPPPQHRPVLQPAPTAVPTVMVTPQRPPPRLDSAHAAAPVEDTAATLLSSLVVDSPPHPQ